MILGCHKKVAVASVTDAKTSATNPIQMLLDGDQEVMSKTGPTFDSWANAGLISIMGRSL